MTLLMKITPTWKFLHREKGRDLSQSYDKAPAPKEKFKKQCKTATKNFDYSTIVDWLRTVSWSSDSNPTDVVKPVYGILLTTKAV